MSFVLDTDHCVEIFRNRLDVMPYVAADEPLYVTAIGVSELAYGAQVFSARATPGGARAIPARRHSTNTPPPTMARSRPTSSARVR